MVDSHSEDPRSACVRLCNEVQQKKKKNQYSRQSINGPSQALSIESRDIKEAFLWELAPLARCRRGIGLCLHFNWVLMSYK